MGHPVVELRLKCYKIKFLDLVIPIKRVLRSKIAENSFLYNHGDGYFGPDETCQQKFLYFLKVITGGIDYLYGKRL